MSEKDKSYQGRGPQGQFGRPDTSLTKSQTGHDTDGRSADYERGGPISSDRAGGAYAAGAASNRATGGTEGPAARRDGGVGEGAADRRSDADLHRGPARATTVDELGDNVDGMGRDRTDMVTADETGKLISADKVIGTAVYNAAGDHLGTIDSVMLHKISGRVAFAVMSFGGFLGIGERYHPLPWDVLTYDEANGGYNIDLPPERLHAAPHYSRDELNRLDYGTSGPHIRDYYGVGSTTARRVDS